MHGQKLVVGSRLYRAAQLSGQLEYRLSTRREGVSDSGRVHAPPVFIERKHAEARLANEVLDLHVGSRIGQIDGGVAREASRFAKVAQDRALIRALLGRAAQLRDGNHGNAKLARQAFQGARDRRDLLDPVVIPTRTAMHQLQIVEIGRAAGRERLYSASVAVSS